MEVYNYNDIEVSREFDIRRRELFKGIMPQLLGEYSNGSAGDKAEVEISVSIAFSNQMPRILWALSGNLEGKVILDLGCGFNSLEGDYFSGRMREPWICRALYALGAYPIGVDGGDLTREHFQHIQVNLIEPNSLSNIPAGSVDLANSWQLLTSPSLDRWGISPSELREHLIVQLEKKLKPGAKFIYDDSV